MLLKMRGLPPKTQASPEDGILAAVEGSDEAAIRWFDTIKVSSKSPPDPPLDRLSKLSRPSTEKSAELTADTDKQLAERQTADFNPQDSRSLELKFCSKLLLSTF